MHSVFVDTSAFVALEDATSPNHRAALAYMGEIRRSGLTPVTTNYVFHATFDQLRTRLSAEAALHFGSAYRRSEFLQKLHVTEQLEAKGWEIARKYATKSLSFTDATSFAALEATGIQYVFTFNPKFKLTKLRLRPQ